MTDILAIVGGGFALVVVALVIIRLVMSGSDHWRS